MNIDKVERYDYSKLIERINKIKNNSIYLKNTNMLNKSVKIIYILIDYIANDESRIIKLREEYKFTAGELKAALKSVLVEKIFTPNELSMINHIIEIYKEKYGAKPNGQKLKCVITAKEFMDNKYISIERYCKDKKINYARFRQLISSLKVIDNELYNDFCKYLELVQKENFLIIKEMWLEIKQKLINGIKIDDDSYRNFDIIDYFEITNLMPNDLYFILMNNNIETDEKALRLFKTFANNANIDSILKPIEIQNFYKHVYQYDMKKDEEGNLIPNSGKIISQDDKVEIINYLQANNIPLCNRVILIALKRYKESTLDTNYVSSKVKVFKR